MKKIYLAAVLLTAIQSFSQSTCVSTFDGFSLAPESYWDGSDQTGGFSGDCLWYYNNVYDTAWGGYWASGWVYSNMTDDTSAGNQFSTYAGGDFTGGGNYLCGTSFSGNLGTSLSFTVPTGDLSFYVANNTYTAISMRDGDMFGKQFGDTVNASGSVDGTNGEDWCKLSIYAYSSGSLVDSQEVYLADYRFSDDTQDYILDTWEFVDFTGTTDIDSLNFRMSSSDVGSFGMNTPAFFCMDHMSADYFVSVAEEVKLPLNFFPNPAQDQFVIEQGTGRLEIYGMDGRLIKDQVISNMESVSIHELPSGMYQLVLRENVGFRTARLIKQ